MVRHAALWKNAEIWCGRTPPLRQLGSGNFLSVFIILLANHLSSIHIRMWVHVCVWYTKRSIIMIYIIHSHSYLIGRKEHSYASVNYCNIRLIPSLANKAYRHTFYHVSFLLQSISISRAQVVWCYKVPLDREKREKYVQLYLRQLLFVYYFLLAPYFKSINTYKNICVRP